MLIEQLLKFPRGLARGRCPPSPVRMRALVRKAILVLLGITSCGCSLSLYQLIDFSTGWKLPCKLCFTQWTFVCLFFFSFGNSQTWYRSTSMAKVLQGPPFIFRFHAMGVQHTAGSKANSCVHFHSRHKDCNGVSWSVTQLPSFQISNFSVYMSLAS